MLDDSCEGAALLQILGCISLQEVIDPVVAVLHDAVAKELSDLLETVLGLLARLSQRAVVRRASGHVALHLGPQQLDRLHLRTEGRRIDQRMTGVAQQLLHHGAV